MTEQPRHGRQPAPGEMTPPVPAGGGWPAATPSAPGGGITWLGVFTAVLVALVVWTLVMWGILTVVQHKRDEQARVDRLTCTLAGVVCP